MRLKTVLLVNLDEDSRRIYQLALEAEGYGAESASDSKGAIAVAARLLPAAMVYMHPAPLRDGTPFLRQVKSDPLTAAIPVIAVLPNLPSEEQRAEVGRLGAAAVLALPVSPFDLVSTVGRFAGPPD